MVINVIKDVMIKIATNVLLQMNAHNVNKIT